jgi:hypothetical protein
MKILRQIGCIAGALLCLIASPAAFGQGCDCLLGLKTGSTVTNIDGVVDQEWADASVLDTSVDPSCLKPVPDWNHVNPNPVLSLVDKNVKVYSKRDGTNIYLAFQIPDETHDQLVGNLHKPLSLGERVIIQFDPDGSRGAHLGSGGGLQKDYRLEIYHKWSTGNGGAINLPLDGVQWFDSSVTAANSPCQPGTQDWPQLPIATPAGLAAAAHNDGTGYTLEIKIPLSAMGNPATDIGIAFAIVNDLGYCPNGVCDSTGSGFPAALPLNNVGSPLLDTDPAGCGAWRTPDNFGTGYFTNAAPSVEISHLPVYWESVDINAYPCAADLSDYLYYPGKACKLRLTAFIHNNGAANQTRNILFMWADHGASPAVWRVVQLMEHQTIKPGGGTVSSALWDNVPSGLGDHPCVRVYILPNSYDPAFPMTKILAIASAADLTQMETVYNVPVGSKCNAQKNLTRQADGTVCPLANCNSLSMNQSPRIPSLFSSLFNGVVYAQQPPAKSPIFWTAEEQRRFAADHVALQFRAYGTAPLRLPKRPAYNFIEDLGGAIQLYQTALLKKNGQAPIQLVVGNPANFPRTIWLHVDQAVPAGFGPFTANIDTGPFHVAPGTDHTVKGTARPGHAASCFGKTSSGSAMLLFLGMVVLGRRTLRRS